MRQIVEIRLRSAEENGRKLSRWVSQARGRAVGVIDVSVPSDHKKRSARGASEELATDVHHCRPSIAPVVAPTNVPAM
jgi:hypothetical protein